jgi:ABC-2 type transport system ATP-binding protein
MSDSEFVIQTTGLSKSYDGVDALKNLNLQVPKNSIFAFLGPNGAGKTTTIKLLLGLIRPTSGGGKIFGKDIQRDSVEIRTNVGYLPQDFRFYEHMSARETLDYTAKFFFKNPQNEIDKRVDEMLELVGLSDNAASLDPMGRRDVLAVMERIRKYATIFYCTHILDDVQRVSDTVTILNKGEMIRVAPIEELLKGAGDTVYKITLRGDAESVYASVAALPWVSEIEESRSGDQAIWEVTVNDDAVAEDQLLSLLVSKGLKVAEFGLKEYHLEDIFIDLVEGGAQ